MEPAMTAMDADHSSSSAGESEQAAIAEENQNGSSSSSSSARSYDCIFCKRGFSNAQALGGHMNIHRKDRAKIKQPASHNRPPLPLTDKPVIHPSYYPAMRESLLVPQRGPAGDDTGFSFKWPWIGPRGEGFPGERSWEIGPHQQPLFVEGAWLGGARPPYLLHGRHEVEGLGGETPAVMELDLELRLGPQPQSASMGLKRFL